MATGGRSIEQAFQALIEDRGTCAVCLDIVKDHRALPCQHVFCLTCLKALVRGNTITCPTCQDDSTLKKGNVESLPKSLFLVDMLETMCVECRQKAREMECPHCKKWLCSDCLESCREIVNETRKDLITQSVSFSSDCHKYVAHVRDEQKFRKTHTEATIQHIRRHIKLLSEKLEAAENIVITEVQCKSRTTEKAYDSLISEADKLESEVVCYIQDIKAQDGTLSFEMLRLFKEVKDALDKNFWNTPLPDRHTFKPHGFCIIEETASAGELITDGPRSLDRNQVSSSSATTSNKVTAAARSPLMSLSPADTSSRARVHVARLWHVEQNTPIRDLCNVAINGCQAILYITDRYNLSLVSMEGERLSVSIDSPGMWQALCTSSDTERKQLVVAGADDLLLGPYYCTVYSPQPGCLRKLRTFRLGDCPQFVSWTRQGYIISVQWGPRHQDSTKAVRRLDSGEQTLQNKTKDVRIESPGHVTVCPGTGHIYVSDWESGCVQELLLQGQHCRDIKTPGIIQPDALCIDSRGRSLFVCGEISRDIYLVSLDGTDPRQVIEAPGRVNCLRLFRDRYLAVGMVCKGLAVYDVASLL